MTTAVRPAVRPCRQASVRSYRRGLPSRPTPRSAPAHVAPPYFAQWESPALVQAILRGRMAAREDPAWADSGAATPEEYEWWARRLCGVACLRSILAARGIRSPPSVPLAREILDAGGYRHRDGGGLDGLIYGPFVRYLTSRWSIPASVAAPLTIPVLLDAVDRAATVMASVSPGIRRPAVDPPDRGGHLVLVHARTATEIIIHNPSGDTPATQAGARVAIDRFAAFFAGRGVIVEPGDDRSDATARDPVPVGGDSGG